jgi:hypothetical protein
LIYSKIRPLCESFSSSTNLSFFVTVKLNVSGQRNMNFFPKNSCNFLVSLIALRMLFSSNVFAQSYSIDWQEVNGGCGVCSGDSFDECGTVGGAGIETMEADGYALYGGFWSLLNVFEQGDAHVLSVAYADNGVLVCWGSFDESWCLETSTTLGENWEKVPVSEYQTNGVQTYYLSKPLLKQSFFRLRKQ